MSANRFDLNNKLFLVTGASSGIGYETCKTICKMNGRVIAVARRGELLEKLVSELGPGNSFFAADIINSEELTNLVAHIEPIDGLVHAAGIVKLAPLKFYNEALMDEIRKVGYDSIVHLMNMLVKNKKLNKESSVVMVSSIGGMFGSKANGIYAGVKGALLAISRVWANELAANRIRVNCVAPGMVRTAIADTFADQVSDEAVSVDEKKYPLGYGEPQDVAYPIAFLLSDGAKWITGSTLVIDGGRTVTI